MRRSTATALVVTLLVWNCAAQAAVAEDGSDSGSKALEAAAPPKLEELKFDINLHPNIRQLIGEEFIAATQNNTSKDGFFLFFGADWCGHCRKFKPTFVQMSEEASKRSEGSLRPGFIFHPVEKGKDHVAKLFRVKGYPTLIYLRQNRWWEYKGERNDTKIFEWIDKLSTEGDEGKPYPERLPTFSEEFAEHWEEFKDFIHYQYTNWPIMFFSILGIMLVFLILCISTCSQLASDDSGDYAPTERSSYNGSRTSQRTNPTPRESKKDK